MPNNYLSVLYQHIIQVENKNVGLKVEGHKHTIAPPVKKVGGHMPPFPPPPPPASYASVLHKDLCPLTGMSQSIDAVTNVPLILRYFVHHQL